MHSLLFYFFSVCAVSDLMRPATHQLRLTAWSHEGLPPLICDGTLPWQQQQQNNIIVIVKIFYSCQGWMSPSQDRSECNCRPNSLAEKTVAGVWKLSVFPSLSVTACLLHLWMEWHTEHLFAFKSHVVYRSHWTGTAELLRLLLVFFMSHRLSLIIQPDI